MKKILFLIPPSEWKLPGGKFKKSKLSFDFIKPYNIACHATEKDLKCKWKRYEEAKELNTNIDDWPFAKAIERYSWVMYSAIDYQNMGKEAKTFFDKHFCIFSWMYGMLKPWDKIWNYKLPIESTWLRHFWEQKITQAINDMAPKYVVNLLPNSYQKMLDFSLLHSKIIHVNFFTDKNGKVSKLTHGVKKVKWEWIKNICENSVQHYNDFGGSIEEKWNRIYVHILHS